MMQTLRERWQQLAPRERTILLVGGIVIALSLLFVLAVDPLLSTLDRLERQTARKQKDLHELALLSREYAAKHDRLTKAENRLPPADSRFSLLTFMEEAAATSRVRDRIAGMQPQVQSLPQGYQETAVDLRLDGVQLPELLALTDRLLVLHEGRQVALVETATVDQETVLRYCYGIEQSYN